MTSTTTGRPGPRAEPEPAGRRTGAAASPVAVTPEGGTREPAAKGGSAAAGRTKPPSSRRARDAAAGKGAVGKGAAGKGKAATAGKAKPAAGKGGAAAAKAAPAGRAKPSAPSKARPAATDQVKPAAPGKGRTVSTGQGRTATPARPRRGDAVPTSGRERAPAGAPRAPFVLLVVGLLGGALVSLLLLNTVLAEDAFTLSKLQSGNKLLNQQREALEEEIAREESPERLAYKAKSLGMTQPSRPSFLDEPTGRVVGDGVTRPVPYAGSAAGAAGVVGAPGPVITGDQLPGWGSPGAPTAPASPGPSTRAVTVPPAHPAGGTGPAVRRPTGGGR